MKGLMRSWFGSLGAAWGVTGVVALLGFAIVRLAPMAEAALAKPLTPLQWLGLGLSLIFFGYTEGYRAFQLQFAPRVVARAFSLIERPSAVRVALAPAFAMGYFGATRKRLIVSWALTAGIVVLVKLVGLVGQPWRGIIDLGVIVALGWGAACIVVLAVQALSGRVPGVETDIPSWAEPEPTL